MEETKDYIPLFDDRFLAPTDIDQMALADQIERGLLEAIEEESPHAATHVPSRASDSYVRVHWGIVSVTSAILTFLGSAWVVRSSLQEEMKNAPILSAEKTMAECPEGQRTVTAIFNHGDLVAIEVCLCETKTAFPLHDAIVLKCSERNADCFVGKYSADHEWIFLHVSTDTGPEGVFFCSEEGIYATLKGGSGCIMTRKEFLESPIVHAFLRSFPRIIHGGKTPVSWGRDTSYGGKRGVERVKKIIRDLQGNL